jgi:hypothetical protein
MLESGVRVGLTIAVPHRMPIFAAGALLSVDSGAVRRLPSRSKRRTFGSNFDSKPRSS